MAAVASAEVAARAELARRELERRKARRDPLYLVSYMSGADENTGKPFNFEHLREPLGDDEVPREGWALKAQDTWRWQRYAGQLILDEKRLVVLKGRQIGVTWLYLAVDVAEAILNPGTSSLVYRQREEDAIDNARRWWVLYQSLPSWWKAGIKVLSPDRAPEPGRDGIKLQFPNGKICRVTPMTSASSSGHGRTVRRILMDEAGHIEKLADLRKAVEPAAQAAGAKIGYISTANGRYNAVTEGGNEFHRLWEYSGESESLVTRLFLPYCVHPDRDEQWLRTKPVFELNLLPHQIQEQYPANAHEAFSLTNQVWFDPEDMAAYRGMLKQPVRRYDFKRRDFHTAQVVESQRGMISELVAPVEGHKYAIGADPATGRGQDSSAAYVIDLATMELVVEFHGRLDADEFAFQLHYLGRRYFSALIAVEVAGGYGEAVIIPLRDGREGRPAYPAMYRHVLSSRPDMPIAKPLGFPTNMKTRPQILNLIERGLRERSFPWLTDGLLGELENFVKWETGTSPRAASGFHDDRVMAFAIALEMWRQRGEHEFRVRKKAKKRFQHWLQPTT